MSRSEGEEGSVVGEDGRSRRPSRRYQVVRSAPSALVREEDGDEEGSRMSRNRNRRDYDRRSSAGRRGRHDNRDYEDDGYSDVEDDFDDTVTSVKFQQEGIISRPHRGPGTASAKRRISITSLLEEDDDDDGEEKSLYQLARDGDLKTIRSLLGKIKESKVIKVVNQLDSNKISVLHYASRYDHFDLVKYLVEKGADPNIRGDDGLTPLHHCAKYKINVGKSNDRPDSDYYSKPMKPLKPAKNLNRISNNGIGKVLNGGKNNFLGSDGHGGRIDTVVEYLSFKGARVNEKDKYGLSPLHYAAMRGNDDAAKELLLCREIDIEIKDEQLLTPLHLACTYGMVTVAKILLENGANIRSSGEKKQTALHKACAVGSFRLVDMLTYAAKQMYGKDEIKQMLKEADIDSNTPLLLAVESGDKEIVRHLVELGADVNQPNQKNRAFPLHLACTVGEIEIVKLLLHNSAIINSVNQNYQTPLMVASAYNQVEVIKYLLKKGAKIDKKDKESFTPLLLAVSEGKADAVEVLLDEGADIYAVDREDRNALYWAAAKNNLDAVRTILRDNRSQKLLEAGDRRDNTPLHIAAQHGFLSVAVRLMDAGADVDNKNEDEETPLHLAAKEGRTRICKEILERDRVAVNDEDSNSNTALHLACSFGHHRVVDVLIRGGAEIEARNYYLWTPLDCAAAYGQTKCAKLLLDANSSVDPMDKNKTTPLHLTARYGNERTADLLIEYGASLTQVNSDGHNALTIAILHGKRDVALTILECDGWLDAMKSQYLSPVTDTRETPLRLLVKQFPDLAKKAFDRCLQTNLQSQAKQERKQTGQQVSADDPRFSITLNYELLDDAYCLFEEEDGDDKSIAISIGDDEDNAYNNQGQVPWADAEIFDDTNFLVPTAKPYTGSKNVLKSNHPLMIMADEERTNLLGHPLCMALVRHKWNSFGRYVYYFTLFLYFTFVIFLTDFMINTPAPYSYQQILKFGVPKDMTDDTIDQKLITVLDSHKNDGYGSEACCLEVQTLVTLERRFLAQVGKLVIILLGVFHLVKEVFQLAQARLSYFGFENMMEWVCYLTAILLVYDVSQCHQETGLREDWQWQVGAVSVTASWLNLLSNVRKFPFLGIYVVMFTNVFKTFLRFSIICALFIIAFTLGFQALIAESPNFSKFGYASIKTAVMMIGEYEFDEIFFYNPDAPEAADRALLPYRSFTLLFFLVFMVIMTIIIMNLLVGLAVDNIKMVQENAALQRLAMQVELNLDVEKLLPEWIRRRFMVKEETVYPNKRIGILSRILNDNSTLNQLAQAVVAKGHETLLQRVEVKVDDLENKIRLIKENMKTLSLDLDSMKNLQGRMARDQGLDYEEEDNEN